MSFDLEGWINAYDEPPKFENIGPGQVARRVIQVIGKKGPVLNPKGIRYLSAKECPTNLPALNPSQSPDLSNLTPFFAGLNFIASVANLAVSGVTLYKIRDIEKQIEKGHQVILETIDDRCDRIEDILGDIKERITHIDMKVMELHLMASLDVVARSCVVNNTINLLEIKKVKSEIDEFTETIDKFEYVDFDRPFKLALHTERRLKGLYWFLFGIRKTVGEVSSIEVDYIEDYRPRWFDDELRELRRDRRRVERKHEEAKESVWLWHTDMGLIWRLLDELEGIGNYEEVFGWVEDDDIDELPTKSNQLMIDCSSGQFIGLDA